jgi:hypothetical protein
MNVEIGAVAAQFPEKEYIIVIAVAVRPGCHLPNSSWPGINKLFPVRESSVSDIPTGDGKMANIFYSVI